VTEDSDSDSDPQSNNNCERETSTTDTGVMVANAEKSCCDNVHCKNTYQTGAGQVAGLQAHGLIHRKGSNSRSCLKTEMRNLQTVSKRVVGRKYSL